MVSKTFGDKAGPLATGDLDAAFAEVEETVVTQETIASLEQQVAINDASLLAVTQLKVALDGSTAMSGNLPIPAQSLTATGSIAANLDTVNAKDAAQLILINQLSARVAALEASAPAPPPPPSTPINTVLPVLTVNGAQTLISFGAGVWSPAEDSNTYRMRAANRTSGLNAFTVLASLVDRAVSSAEYDCDLQLEETAIKSGVLPSPIAFSQPPVYITSVVAPPAPAPAPPQTPAVSLLELVASDGYLFDGVYVDNGWGGHQPRIIAKSDRTPSLIYHRSVSGAPWWRVMERTGVNTWVQRATAQTTSVGYAMVREPATDAIHVLGWPGNQPRIYSSPSYAAVVVPGTWSAGFEENNYASMGAGPDGSVVIKAYLDVTTGGGYSANTDSKWTAGKRSGTAWNWSAQQSANAQMRHLYDYIMPAVGGDLSRFVATATRDTKGQYTGLPNLTSDGGFYFDGIRQWSAPLSDIAGYQYGNILNPQPISGSATSAPRTYHNDSFADSQGRVLSLVRPTYGGGLFHLITSNDSGTVLNDSILGLPAGGGGRVFEDAAGAYRILWSNFSGSVGGAELRIYALTYSGNVPTLGSFVELSAALVAAGIHYFYPPRIVCPRAGCSIIDRLDCYISGADSQSGQIWYMQILWGASAPPAPPPPPPPGASFNLGSARTSIGEDYASGTALQTEVAVNVVAGDMIEFTCSWFTTDTTCTVETFNESGGATIDASGGFTARTKKVASAGGRWIQKFYKLVAVGGSTVLGRMNLSAAGDLRTVSMRVVSYTGTASSVAEPTATDTASGTTNTITFADLVGSTQKYLSVASVAPSGGYQKTVFDGNWTDYTWSPYALHNTQERLITGTATAPTGGVVSDLDTNLTSVGAVYAVS